jgi:DNA-binding NtrC family response regulator
VTMLLIADDNAGVRTRLEQLLRHEGYEVLATASVAGLIEGISERGARVVIVGGTVEGVAVAELAPVLKGCASGVQLIVVDEEGPVPALRKLRKEGIFYHLQPPVDAADGAETKQAVACALRKCGAEPRDRTASRLVPG